MAMTMDGKIYRCVRPQSSPNDFGKWDFLYNDKWHEVISYTIRVQLNRQYKYDQNLDAKTTG